MSQARQEALAANIASQESDERSRKLQAELDEAVRKTAQQHAAFMAELDAREQTFRHAVAARECRKHYSKCCSAQVMG